MYSLVIHIKEENQTKIITHFFPAFLYGFIWLTEAVNLPEVLEPLTIQSSVCYGLNNIFQPTCEHRNGTVIAINAVKVGSKLLSTGCPSSTDSYLPNCCMPNFMDDCIFNYSYNQFVHFPTFQNTYVKNIVFKYIYTCIMLFEVIKCRAC